MSSRAGGSGSIPADILDDLSVRFLVNLPDAERSDPVRVCFQAELAHWFYTDYYSMNTERYPHCAQIGVRDFIRTLFHHCPMLRKDAHNVDAIIDAWRSYKSNVPTYGAILLDKRRQNILLVQGYYAKNSWGFPKGKVNEEETPEKCAAREVYEETGFDCSALIDPDCFIHRSFGDNSVHLFIVPNVPTDFNFVPLTRNEIKKIQWFAISDIPVHKQDTSGASRGLHAHHFFMVSPFVNDLRTWLSAKYRGRGQRVLSSSHSQQVASSSGSAQHRRTPNRSRLHSAADEHLGTGALANAGAKPRRSPQPTAAGGSRSGGKQAKAKAAKSTGRPPAGAQAHGSASAAGAGASAGASANHVSNVWDKLRVSQPQAAVQSRYRNASHMSVDATGDVSSEARRRRAADADADASCHTVALQPAAAWCHLRIDWTYVLGEHEHTH